MNYEDEAKEDKKYKRSYGRKEFKKDVADAVKPELENLKKGRKKKAAPLSGSNRGSKNMYAGWKVGALRKHLNEKKKSLLTKAGFPDGAIPRSKEAMINLCKKLKRKRW